MTLKVRVIPCLDVKDGRVVKGVRFVDLTDAGDPVEAARAYDAAGADELCFLDITASHERRGIILDVVARTAEQCFMPVTVGGGVRTVADVRALLLAGADKVSINTGAIERREVVREASEKFGAQAIVVAVDAKRVSAPGAAARFEVFTHGGRNATGLDAVRYAVEVAELGAGEILLTSMDRDGTGDGFDLELTRQIADAVPIPVVASGGVGNLDHLVDGVREGHASAVLAASIFHFGTFTIRQAKEHMAAAGIPIRLDGYDPISGRLAMSAFTLAELADIVAKRAASADPASSYTAKLLADGVERCARKFGEEAVEAVIAALGQDDKALTGEAADVLYHLLVLIKARGISLDAVMAELEARTRQSGLQEKTARGKA